MFTIDPKIEAKDDLKNLLRKLGLKSASYVTGTLTEQDLINMMSQVQNNYGTPDELILDADTFKALKKMLKV